MLRSGKFQRKDGSTYAPEGRVNSVCEKGEFRFSVIGLDHGHIFGMCNGLIEAGAELISVFDPDPEKVEAFVKKFPGVLPAQSSEDVYADSSINLIACAAIPCERGEIGVRAMLSGKDFFADKPPFVSVEQLDQCRRVARDTGRKFFVYFSERIHVEAAVYAEILIKDGTIGRVVHMDGFGPHRLSREIRPEWFYDRSSYGGIICDIGSHQIEQFLYYSNTKKAKIDFARTANYHCPEHPDFEDFGEIVLTGDNGATCHIRLDWFTPDALPVWGDGRTFIIGTDGYIELRKYINVGESTTANHVYICNQTDCKHIEADNTVGFPFFGCVIRDCLDRTETAMSQEHVFYTMELALEAQNIARFDNFLR